MASEKAGEFCQYLKRNDEVWHKLHESAKDAAGNLSSEKIARANKLYSARTVTGEKKQTATVCDTAGDSSPSSVPPSVNSNKTGPKKMSKKTVGANRGAWGDLQPADDMPLYFENTGIIAEKFCTDDGPENASGYHFCRVEQTIAILQKFAQSGHRVKPALFSMPARNDTKEVEDLHLFVNRKLRSLQKTEHGFVPLIVEGASLATTNPKSDNPGQVQRVDCLLLHIDKDDKIGTAHALSQGDESMTAGNKPPPVANLTFQPSSTTEIQVAILEPICRELGLASWFKELIKNADKDFEKLKTSLKELVKHPELKQLRPRVRRNRTLKWRGEETQEGRISTTIAIPNECVEEVLSRSGIVNGAIFDLPGAAEMEKYSYAKVKLPSDLTIKQATAKVAELAPELRRHTRGIVPTYKGYAVRVTKAMEVEITSALSPELAAELGQALGMKANSTWKVSGIPTYVSKGSLHQAFARQAYGWTGWIVRPVKTLSAPKNGKVDWIVEAASNPPKQTFTINSRDVVCIEEHFALASKRASA